MTRFQQYSVFNIIKTVKSRRPPFFTLFDFMPLTYLISQLDSPTPFLVCFS